MNRASNRTSGPSTSLLASFSKAQITAFIATMSAFGVLFSMTEILHVWYVAATASGAMVGAITNFLLNRHWSFNATHSRWRGQAFRYFAVSTMSMLLNSAGAYFFTEILHIHYSISVVAVSVVIGILFNFPMHRYFVFR